jgi:hypothetical protein
MTRRILPVLVAVLLTAGCTNDQVTRAEGYAQTAHTLLDQAVSHVGALEQQLAVARKAAADSGDARIVAVADQLQSAVAVAKTYLPTLQATAAQADATLAQMKASPDVPWWKVAVGIAVPLLLPFAKGIPVVGPAIGQLGELAWAAYSTHDQKAQQAAIEARAKGLAQTVAGIENAKKLMTPDQVESLHGSLAEAQDSDVKAVVSQFKATL